MHFPLLLKIISIVAGVACVIGFLWWLCCCRRRRQDDKRRRLTREFAATEEDFAIHDNSNVGMRQPMLPSFQQQARRFVSPPPTGYMTLHDQSVNDYPVNDYPYDNNAISKQLPPAPLVAATATTTHKPDIPTYASKPDTIDHQPHKPDEA